MLDDPLTVIITIAAFAVLIILMIASALCERRRGEPQMTANKLMRYRSSRRRWR